MRIDIDINDQYPDTSVTIHAPRLSQDIEKMIAMMRMLDMQISAERNGETYILDANQILYIEAVERKTFIYTETDMYESELKLYEVEEQLLERDFLRISKQSIVNLRMIKSLKADINRKIKLTLKNGEQIMVSRMYADELRVEGIRTHLEVGGKVGLVRLTDVDGHVELDVPVDMEVWADDVRGRLDVNQVGATSVLHVAQGTAFTAKARGHLGKRTLRFTRDGQPADPPSAEDAPLAIELAGARCELTVDSVTGSGM